MSELRNTVL